MKKIHFLSLALFSIIATAFISTANENDVGNSNMIYAASMAAVPIPFMKRTRITPINRMTPEEFIASLENSSMSYEGSMNYGELSHLVQSGQLSPAVAKKIVGMVKTKAAPGRGMMPTAGGGAAGLANVPGQIARIQQFIERAVGELDLNIKRMSADINQPLPYALFGTFAFNDKYRIQIAPYIPAGIELIDVKALANGNVEFSYKETSTGKIDSIQVAATGKLAYSTFLSTLTSNIFHTNVTKYGISDLTQLSQYNRGFNWETLTSLGKTGSDQISPFSQRSMYAQTSDLIDFLLPYSIDAETSIIQSINPKSGFEISMAIYIDEKEAINRHSLK